MTEHSIVTANAVILQYDSSSGQWRELGSESGLCEVSILKSPSNEYRYVAQKISNRELVLNAYIFPEMKYDETTPNFHQWYDKSKTAFGLNFLDATVAKKYAAAIAIVLETLNTPNESPKITAAVSERKTFGTGSGTSYKAPSENPPRSNTKVSPYATSTVGANVTPINPSSATKVTAVKSSAGAPPPPGPPPPGPAPPGPPPPGPSIAKPPSSGGNNFASQLQKAAAQHKAVDIDEKINKPPPVLSESKPTTNPQPAAGGMDFLSEMKLRMNKKTQNEGGAGSAVKVAPVKTTPTYGAGVTNSQSIVHRPSVVDSEPTLSSSYVTAADLEKFRIDLMNDILKNMEKMKNEIISSISAKLN